MDLNKSEEHSEHSSSGDSCTDSEAEGEDKDIVPMDSGLLLNNIKKITGGFGNERKSLLNPSPNKRKSKKKKTRT